jgi:hypothetical protein
VSNCFIVIDSIYAEKDTPCQINIIIHTIPPDLSSPLPHKEARASSYLAIFKISQNLLKGSLINIHNKDNLHSKEVMPRGRRDHRCHLPFRGPTIIAINNIQVIHNLGGLQAQAHQNGSGAVEAA